MKRKILTGLKFGRLLVTAEKGKHTFCECDCGDEVTVLRSNIMAGYTQSCGCLRNERISAANSTHGMSRTQMYNIWRAMKGRCYNPQKASYRWYGAKGIKVCDRWHDYENFFADMIHTYRPGLSIDRIDSSKDYEPSNCQWLTLSDNVRKSHGTQFS